MEAAGAIKAVQNPVPPPGSRKLVGEAAYQTRAQHLNEESLFFRTLSQPLAAESPCHTQAGAILASSCWPWSLWGSGEASGIPITPWAHPDSGTGCPTEEDRKPVIRHSY